MRDLKRKQKVGRKICSIFLTAAISFSIVFSGAGSAFAEREIADINKSADYAKASIEALARNGIISGDEKGNFNPAKNVKRNEMVRMIISALGADTSILPEKATFTDVSKNNWAFKYVETAYRLGLVKGISKNVFGADKELSREEMAAMFVRAAGLDEANLKGNQIDIYSRNLKDIKKISSWASEYVEFALACGIMQGTGDGSFAPANPAQRQQVAVVTDRFISKSADINRFAASFNGKMQHTELYNALVANGISYKGGMDMLMDLSFKDDSGEDSFDMSMSAIGYIDSAIGSMDVTYDLSTGTTGNPALEMNYRIIKLADKLYVKYLDEDEWTIMDESELGDIDLAGPNENTQALTKFYRYAEILKSENVMLGDTAVTKYKMNFKPEEINVLMSELIYSQVYEGQSQLPVITGDNPYEITLFINSNGQIIKEEIKFSGNMVTEDTKENIYIEIILKVDYYNINEGVDIKVPVV